MNVYFSGELLILLLLLPVVLRSFFPPGGKNDKTSILAFIAFLFSLCLIAAAGFSVAVICVAGTSLYVLIINIGAISRFLQHLQVDAYSPALIIASIFALVFIAGSAFVITGGMTMSDIRYARMTAGAGNVREETRMTGNFTNGFKEKTSWDEQFSAVFYRFYAENDNEGVPFEQPVVERPVVIFIPDVYATAEENRATIQAIASRCNVVISGDFYVSDEPYIDSFFNNKIFRSFSLRKMKYLNPEQIPAFAFHWTQLKLKELESLFKYVHTHYPEARVFCVAADGNAAESAELYMRRHPSERVPVFAITSEVPGYISGLGNVAIFQPVVYRYIANTVTDGYIQAQQIAARVEKLK